MWEYLTVLKCHEKIQPTYNFDPLMELPWCQYSTCLSRRSRPCTEVWYLETANQWSDSSKNTNTRIKYTGGKRNSHTWLNMLPSAECDIAFPDWNTPNTHPSAPQTHTHLRTEGVKTVTATLSRLGRQWAEHLYHTHHYFFYYYLCFCSTVL